MSRIGVLGAGTWGIALARMLANSGHDVLVWSVIKKEIDELKETGIQRNLPGVLLPETIKYTDDIEEAVKDKEIILCAVPSPFVRSTIEKIKPYYLNDQIIVDVAKGIEADTLFTMTGIIKDVLSDSAKVVALSGPTHAEEVAKDMPTTIVSACEDIEIAEKVQDIFMNTCMRVYTNTDVIGVELCGAMKNIVALASGISSGLGFGDNTKAAIITRGIHEIASLGFKMGCTVETFAGLAGIGDLIVTATSVHSRNNRCGYLIGQGKSAKDAITEVGMVVEGINAIPAAMKLMKKYDVEMPIITAVNDIVNNGKDPMDAVNSLMQRDKRNELAKNI